MADEFNIENFRKKTEPTNQYDRQLARLRAQQKEIGCIETAIERTLASLERGSRFVIYGVASGVGGYQFRRKQRLPGTHPAT